MPANESEEKEIQPSKRKKTEDPGESPMHQQRMVREVSEEEDENKTSRAVSLTTLTIEDGLAQRRLIIREAETSDEEEAPKVKETEVYQSVNKITDIERFIKPLQK